MDQNSLPIITALKANIAKGNTSFHMPGHKNGKFLDEEFLNLVGTGLHQIDITEIPGLDNLHVPQGIIKEAQALAAEAFGGDKSYFLVNGSTAGIQAMLLAGFDPGDEIIIPRNVHVSILYGIIQAGLKPIYINPIFNEKFNIYEGITGEQIEKALLSNPLAKGILLVNPSYLGICLKDLENIITAIHNYGKLVLVDEAHGAHLYFNRNLPTPALTAGADMVTLSAHKTMGSLTQTAILHIKGSRVNRARLESALDIVQSTSPSYPLMASLDCARRKMFFQGEEALDKIIYQGNDLKARINKIASCKCLEQEDLKIKGTIDPTKILVNFANSYLTADEVGRILREEYHIEVELILGENILFLTSVGNTVNDFEKLGDALEEIHKKLSEIRTQGDKLDKGMRIKVPKSLPIQAMIPREAWFSSWEEVPFKDSLNRISAQWLAPYPPGIPLLVPGEVISEEVLLYIEYLVNQGVEIQGAADPRLKTLRVLEDKAEV